MRLKIFLTILLCSCSARDDGCLRSSDVIEKDAEKISGVQILLHTRPLEKKQYSSTIEMLNHEWALVLRFPDTKRVMTHWGEILKDGQGVSCFQHNSPLDNYGLWLLGNASGSPRSFLVLSEKTGLSLSYYSMPAYNQNWVMSMVKSIGGKIWTRLSNFEAFFANEDNRFSKSMTKNRILAETTPTTDPLGPPVTNNPSHGNSEENSKNFETSISSEIDFDEPSKQRAKGFSFGWDDFLCLASIAWKTLKTILISLIPLPGKQKPLIQWTECAETLNKIANLKNKISGCISERFYSTFSCIIS